MGLSLSQLEPAINPALLPALEIEALYVHVPFCFHKCHYCDFYSITRQSRSRMERYVDLVLKEAEHWTCASPGPRARPRTIFFGGGTPTLLPVDCMQRLIAGLRERLDISQCDEFTVEANPATVTGEYAKMLRESGVDRLSFGAQSFDAGELKTLEREHDPDDVSRSVELARTAGFTRINLDLIYAIPGQSVESWQRSLDAALSMTTPHLSCYNLTYETNTPLAVRKRLGHFVPADEDTELAMFRETRRRLQSGGYEAYEISNFASPGEACRHNLTYWTGGNYIGLGPSAASHVEGWRWKNRPHLGEWENAVSDNLIPSSAVEQLTPTQRRTELAMLTLRLASGLNFAGFAERTGCDARDLFSDVIERFSGTSLIRIDADALRLTESGLNVADAIAAEFLAAQI